MDPALQKIASHFVDFTYSATRLPVIVCDETGTIRFAVDRKRVGTVHDTARRIAAGERDEAFVTAEQAARDPKMKEGCNRVILLDGRRVGTFGIAGPVEVTRPMSRIAAAVIAAWAKEDRLQSQLRGAAENVFQGFQEVSRKASLISEQATRTVTKMTEGSTTAAQKVAESGEIVKTVMEVAQKSRILSINGSVEASRAGERGRAFSVIAQEMIRLSEDARAAANQIQRTLGDVQASVGTLGGAVGDAAALMKQQSAALDEIQHVVDALKGAVAELIRATA